MYTGLLHTHTLVVVLFLVSLLIKTVLLLANKKESLQKFRKKTLVPEMIIDTLMVVTGIVMAFNSGAIQMGNWFWIKMVAVLAAIPLSIVAFRKESKVLAVLGLVLVLYAYGISETKSATMNKAQALVGTSDDSIDESMPVLALGEAVYLANCAICHGNDGNKGHSGAKPLSSSQLSEEEVLHRIQKGKNAMPGYEGLLSEEKIKAVAAYVLSMRD